MRMVRITINATMLTFTMVILAKENQMNVEEVPNTNVTREDEDGLNILMFILIVRIPRSYFKDDLPLSVKVTGSDRDSGWSGR